MLLAVILFLTGMLIAVLYVSSQGRSIKDNLMVARIILSSLVVSFVGFSYIVLTTPSIDPLPLSLRLAAIAIFFYYAILLSWDSIQLLRKRRKLCVQIV